MGSTGVGAEAALRDMQPMASCAQSRTETTIAAGIVGIRCTQKNG